MERLEMLAELWGKVYLFHPAIVRKAPVVDWNRAFVDVLPAIEQAGDAPDVVRILNEDFFSLLDDPLTFAQLRGGPDSTFRGSRTSGHAGSHGCNEVASKTLPGAAAVRHIAARRPGMLRKKDFADGLRRALFPAGTRQAARDIVLDLRWSELFDGRLPDGFLGLWADRPWSSAPRMLRVHRGRHEVEWPWPYVYSERWEISEGRRLENPCRSPDPHPARRDAPPDAGLRPGAPHLPGRTSFDPIEHRTMILVNNASVLHLRQALPALQSGAGGRSIRVVWERTGRFAVPKFRSLRYPEQGVEAHLCADGVRFQPDMIFHDAIPEDELPGLLARVFAVEPCSPVALSPFHIARASQILPEADSACSPGEPLSRAGRLLGLVKIRTILKYFYPHFDRSDVRPDDILARWAPEVAAAEDLKAYFRTLEGLLAKLNDSHARLMHPTLLEEENAGIPVRFGAREGKVVVLDAGGDAGLRPGDELIAVDGSPMNDLTAAWRTRISASSEQAFRRDFLRRVRTGREGGEKVLTIRGKDAAIRQVRVRCEASEPRGPERLRERPRPAVEAGPPIDRFTKAFGLPGYAHCVRKLDDNLAYMTPFEISGSAALAGAFALIRDTDGLILDFRGYPKTHFQHELVRLLCEETVPSPRAEIPLASDRESTEEENRFVIRDRVRPKEGNGNSVRYGKPVVALIDEETQSSAEDFCMLLRIAGRAIFVGCATAGCTGNAGFIRLPAGGRMSFTGMRVTWPDGSPFQGIGVAPDVEVEQTIRGAIEGRDEILEKGIEVLKALAGNELSH